jgi:hypothetical protein
VGIRHGFGDDMIPPAQLKDLQVLLTILGGRIVCEAQTGKSPGGSDLHKDCL